MKPNIKQIQNKIYYWLFIALAFFIPVYDKVSALIIALLLLNWILEGQFRQKFRLVLTNKQRRTIFLFSTLYFAYLLGMTYTANWEYGLFDLETKLSILVFPLLFSSIDFQVLRDRLWHFLVAFLAGNLLTTIILLIHATINYYDSKSTSEFFYGGLSWFHHASYIAMFLVFSVGIICYHLLTEYKAFSKRLKIILISLLIYFSQFIILLSSKAGLLSLAIILVSTIGFVFYQKKYIKGFLFILIVVAVFWSAFNFLPTVSSRINSAQDALTNENLGKDTRNSTGERILIWQSAVQIIKENFLFGVGTGDVKDRLLWEYNKNEITTAYELKLNAHNQYLQTYIAIGMFGFLILIATLLLPFISAIKKRQIILLLFLFLFSFNLLFESMLERQAGVVFYAFFNGLLFFYLNEREIDKIET